MSQKVFARIERLLGARRNLFSINKHIFEMACSLQKIDINNELTVRKQMEKASKIALPWDNVILPFPNEFVFIYEDGEFDAITLRHGVYDFECDGSATSNLATGEVSERLNLYATATFSGNESFINTPTLEPHVLGYFSVNVVNLICQIIARQDFVERQTVDYSKLNKKRAKTGKPPLPTMTRIVLKRSAEELAKNTIQMHAVNADQTERGKRRLHDVRSHLRLKNGKIEIVRAHKRGDASLGSVEQLRIVR